MNLVSRIQRMHLYIYAAVSSCLRKMPKSAHVYLSSHRVELGVSFCLQLRLTVATLLDIEVSSTWFLYTHQLLSYSLVLKLIVWTAFSLHPVYNAQLLQTTHYWNMKYTFGRRYFLSYLSFCLLLHSYRKLYVYASKQRSSTNGTPLETTLVDANNHDDVSENPSREMRIYMFALLILYH